VVEVPNSLFGGEVTVAGLVPGEDVIAALQGTRVDRIVLPRSMLDMNGQLTIDGISVQEIADRLATPIGVGSSPAELVTLTTQQTGAFDIINPRQIAVRGDAAST